MFTTMKKNLYTAPEVSIVNLNIADGIMLIASENGQGLLGNGGDTSTYNVTESDVKSQRYSVWDDDWSKVE